MNSSNQMRMRTWNGFQEREKEEENTGEGAVESSDDL